MKFSIKYFFRKSNQIRNHLKHKQKHLSNIQQDIKNK